MKRLCFVVMLCLWGYVVSAQESCIHADERELFLMMDTPSLGYIGMDSSDSVTADRWRVGVDVTTFMRDAEFSLPYTRGYTALGFFAKPYVSRNIGSRAKITLGALLTGAAGYEGLHSWIPVARMEYRPAAHLKIIMGTIDGGLAHRLYEPMLDRERYIYDHQEEGMQILADPNLGSLRLRSDTWIHWEDLLEPWQPKQERFTMGTSNELELFSRPLGDDASLGFLVPISFLGSHRGGQFTSLDTCIQSLFNESVGLRMNLTSDYSTWSVDVPCFFYQDISPTKCMAFDDGWGVWPQLTYGRQWSSAHDHSYHLLAQLGYWYGHQYLAPRGSYLFQSISWHKSYFTAPERSMATAKLAWEDQYRKNFGMGLDVEFYYDMVEKGLDIAFGLYMRYRMN